MDLAQYAFSAGLVEGRSVRAVVTSTGRSKTWVQRRVNFSRVPIVAAAPTMASGSAGAFTASPTDNLSRVGPCASLQSFAHSVAINANLSALVDWKRSTRRVSQEGEILLLFGHLTAQSQQLRPLGRTERPAHWSPARSPRVDVRRAPLCSGNSSAPRARAPVSNRSSGVDDAGGRF